jgi:DNA-binding CsgD family transcriptional regulator
MGEEDSQKAPFYRLRQGLLDTRRGSAPTAMLDCCAHMLLYFNDPSMMQQIGLAHLLERLVATRVEIGFGCPDDAKFRPCATRRRTDHDFPDGFDVAYHNSDRAIQTVWRSGRSVYFNIQHDLTENCLPVMRRLGTRARLARRLEYGGRSFGLVCIDHAEKWRRWSDAEQTYLDQFVLEFLSPVMAEARSRQADRCLLTPAENAVVRLAARGLSYKEIAAELRKSPNTVDNQLRRIRERLGVRNQVELVRACADLL